MSRRVLTLVVGLVSILAVFTVYFGFYGREDKKINVKTEAATSSKTLTTDADWNAGTKSGAVVSGDSVQIDPAVTNLNLAAIYEADHSRLTADFPNPERAIDGDISTYFGEQAPESFITWTMDLGQTYRINEFKYYMSVSLGSVSSRTSTDGVIFTDHGSNSGFSPPWMTNSFAPVNARYIRLYTYAGGCVGDCWNQIFEVQVYGSSMATHTSSATQLDGGTHFKDWTTFVPDDDIPANTSVGYRFRSSTDSTTWGSYTASSASAASINIATLLGAGDAAKRYLQVETTLANTDGASTPTLNAYTANYNYSALDHLTVTPASASVVVNGTQSLTASAIDDFGDPILDATFTWSTTCGAVDAVGSTVTFTAPAAVPGGSTCTVTASSTVDGVTKTGDSVITITASPPTPTCSDGIQNGTETGVDCGGSCTACTVTPPVTCPATGESGCFQQSLDAESLCFSNPPAGKTQQECVSDARCAEAECIVACGGSGADMAVGTKVLVPNGGETYQLTRTMTVNWVYGNGNTGIYPDPSKGEKTTFQSAPIGVVLSTDGGTTYDKMLEMIYPAHLGGLTGSNVYSDWIAGQYGGYKPYTSYHAYNADSALNNGYYSYSFYIPNSISLVSDSAKIKLVPVVFGCGGIINPDASDNNFRIIASPAPPAPSSITLSASPDQAYLKPEQTQQYSAQVVDQSGVDITASCPVTWSMQVPTAGTINSSGLMTATSTLGVWMHSVRATANCYGLTEFELLDFVTTNEARRLEYVWTSPWSTAVKDPIKSAANNVSGYDQFNLFIPNASYSMSLLDSRIGTIPTNGRNVNIATSNNYGCYPNKIKGTAVYGGVEKSAFGSITIYPPDYAFNSSNSGCGENKVSLSEKILARLTGADKAHGAEGQVFTSVSYGAPSHLKPGQTAQYYGNTRDQVGAPMGGVKVEAILHNSNAGQLSTNGKFIATNNIGSYPGAVEIKASSGTKVISKTFDLTVTNEKRKAKSIYVYGPAGSTDLTTKRILRMWKGSNYSFYTSLADQFKDMIGSVGQAKIEDVSGKNLVDILGPTSLQAKNTEGTFKDAIKVTYDIDLINSRNIEEDEKIDGPSPVIYLTLDINSANDNPTACFAGHPPICDPLDPDCVNPCTGANCTPCIGPLCNITNPIKTLIDGILENPLPPGIAAIAGLLALLALALSALANLLTVIRPADIWALFARGKEKKHSSSLVYDTSSGLPIPLAKLLLYRARDNRLLSVAISDRDGRFALEIPPGEDYYIEAKKDGYKILESDSSLITKNALAYENNYFAKEKIASPEGAPIFNKVIPMTATAELNKMAKSARAAESFSKVLRIINIPIIVFGFAAAVYSLNQSKTTYNFVVVGVYVLVLIYALYRKFVTGGRTAGFVYKSADRKPVDLAIVRAINEMDGKLVKTTVTGNSGKYTLPLPKGFYKILVTKAGLETEKDLSVRIKNTFDSANEKVGLRENQRRDIHHLQSAPTQTTAPVTPTRVFHDTAEIIGNYSGQISELQPKPEVAQAQQPDAPSETVPNPNGA